MRTHFGDLAHAAFDIHAVEFSTLKPSENVRLQAFEVADGEKPNLLYRLLNKESGRYLIFSRTKRGTERIARSLNRQGLGIRMERVYTDGGSFEEVARTHRPGLERLSTTPRPRMIRLPGEFLQAQMDC